MCMYASYSGTGLRMKGYFSNFGSVLLRLEGGNVETPNNLSIETKVTGYKGNSEILKL